MQAASLADLASRGWVIVSVDHTYDAAAVVFPDGTVVLEQPGLLTSLFDDLPTVGSYLTEIRSADISFVRRALRNATGTAGSIFGSGTNGPDLDRVGLLGGSLGGAVAAELLLEGDPPYLCGANLDGGVYGPVLSTPEPLPFLTLATPGHNSTQDDTWAAFFSQLDARGAFWRAITVNGTVHQSFLDIPLLRDLLPPVGEAVPAGAWGTIGGERLLALENELLDAIYGYCVKGKSSAALDTLVKQNPELSPTE